MSNYALRVPDSLFEYAKELAKKENCSLNQLIVMALAEKVSSVRTEEFFRERISRAKESPHTLEDLLDMAPDAPPVPGDELPAGWKPMSLNRVQEPPAAYFATRPKLVKRQAVKRPKVSRK